MKALATGLLLAMFILYLIVSQAGSTNIVVGFVRAFAEAALVGGIADWFAVTALFRRPLGLPIPHTAIIPANKDRIGDALAEFLRGNFLTVRVVSRRLQSVDIAALVGGFLAQPSGHESRMREGALHLFAQALQSLDQEQLRNAVARLAELQLRSIDFAPLLGDALHTMIEKNDHLPLLQRVISWANSVLSSNEQLVRSIVHDKAGNVLRWTGLDETLADAILSGLVSLLDEMATDPAHPLRVRAEQGLHNLADDLQHDAVMQARVRGLRDSILANPVLRLWLGSLWDAVQSMIVRLTQAPRGAQSGKLARLLQQSGRALQNDIVLRLTVNRFARRLLVGVASRYGDGVVTLVSATIRRWDARTVSDRIEAAVGSDLQYIRINGTLVGGLVGVAIHALDTWH